MKPAPRVALLITAVVIGVIIGLLGTLVHGNIWVLGEVGSAAVLPWGALLGLLVLFLASMWAGLTSGSLLDTLVLGAVAFTVVSWFYVTGSGHLTVPFSAAAWQMVPGPVIASGVWWLGSGVVTLVAMLVVKWLVVKDTAAQRKIAAT